MKKQKHEGQFKPGQSGNPGGRKPLPDDIKQLKQMRTEEFQRALYTYMGMTVEELKDKAGNATELTWLELILVRAVERTNDSDWKAINDILDRAFGKASQPMEISAPGGGPIELQWPEATEEQTLSGNKVGFNG